MKQIAERATAKTQKVPKGTIWMSVILALLVVVSCTIVGIEAGERQSRPSVFLGDSRTVGMHQVLYNRNYAPEIQIAERQEYWVAKGGMGLPYLQQKEVPALERHGIPQNADIFILMGVNDCTHPKQIAKVAKEYTSYINQKAKDWKKYHAHVYFVSTNPVFDAKSEFRKNTTVETLNRLVKQGLSSGITYVDTYSKLYPEVSRNPSLTDSLGLHYHAATYQTIYQQCLKAAGKSVRPRFSLWHRQVLFPDPVQTYTKNENGRPGAAEAVLSGDTPFTNWTAKPGKDGSCQAYLISPMLSGNPKDSRNQITISPRCAKAMAQQERLALDYIHNAGYRVRYTVTPQYTQKGTLKGVRIHARSIEDHGAGISFNHFCQN